LTPNEASGRLPSAGHHDPVLSSMGFTPCPRSVILMLLGCQHGAHYRTNDADIDSRCRTIEGLPPAPGNCHREGARCASFVPERS
jgi:hypothetical protein